MSELEGETPQKHKIKVFGRFGNFEVPNKDIKVRYFSTVASAIDKGSGEYQLLNELSPMREKVNSKELQDLNSLLQRDLNDARVADELVPYLKGLKSDIAFFPAILGVLIPKEFLQSDSGEYPKPVQDEGSENLRYEFGEYWSTENYRMSGDTIPLGLISIDPNITDIIVLDGQHRSNAFRYVSNIADFKDKIYSAFYHGVDQVENFKAELPVTLIWFENPKNGVKPKLISRNLFVDVNNSAKKVSKSRNILLDDKLITALLTRYFYSSVANNSSFDADKFSLLHSGFDLDTDVSTYRGSAITLTNPEIIEYVISWLMFGSSTYDVLNCYDVSREATRNKISEFALTFDSPGFNREKIKPVESNTEEPQIKNSDYIQDFKTEYENNLNPVFVEIFENFNLFEIHFKACKELEEWVFEKGSTKVEDAWNYVFSGGEGLYYTFRGSPTKNEKINTYQKAIDEIETKFSNLRATYFDDVLKKKINNVYDSILSKAFQVGLFMSLKYLRDRNELENYLEIHEEFIERINKVNPEQWVVILSDIKNKIRNRTNPKIWPTYQKLIIRFIQNDNEFYSSDNFQHSPEGNIFKDLVETKFSHWTDIENIVINELNFEEDVKKDLRKSWYEEALSEIKDLYEKASFDLIEPYDYVDLGDSILKNRLEKLQGKN